MRSIALSLALVALAAPAGAASPERWLTLDTRAPDHGALAMDLNALSPGAEKGVTNARVMVVDDSGAWMATYEADCRKTKMHLADRKVVDRKSGRPTGPAALDAAWIKPAAPVFQRVFDIACKQTSPTGELIADRRALMWSLTR